jgi:hypothetical protein
MNWRESALIAGILPDESNPILDCFCVVAVVPLGAAAAVAVALCFGAVALYRYSTMRSHSSGDKIANAAGGYFSNLLHIILCHNSERDGSLLDDIVAAEIVVLRCTSMLLVGSLLLQLLAGKLLVIYLLHYMVIKDGIFCDCRRRGFFSSPIFEENLLYALYKMCMV